MFRENISACMAVLNMLDQISDEIDYKFSIGILLTHR